jgi:hypothetical protein
MARRQVTTFEQQRRVDKVYTLLLSGSNRQEISQYAEKEWDANQRTVDTLISRARERLSEESAAYRANAMAEHLAARRQLRMQATKNEDWRLLLDVLREEAKLLGLYETELLGRIEALEQRFAESGTQQSHNSVGASGDGPGTH